MYIYKCEVKSGPMLEIKYYKSWELLFYYLQY